MSEQTAYQSAEGLAPSARRTLRFAVLLIGFTAVIAQVTLMRELLVVFYGNELALGVMLANWLLWTAVGAGLLGCRAWRTINPRKLLASLQMLLALALPITLLAVRVSKIYCQTVPGEILGPAPMFLTSFVTLSLFCLISGGSFSAGSRLFAVAAGAPMANATGTVYLLEAAGSGLGGVAAGLFLVRLSNPFVITALLGVLNLLAAWRLFAAVTSRRRSLSALFGALTAIVIVLGCELQPLSLAKLWQGFDLVAARNSIYGSLAVVQTRASRSLFENGLITLTVPDLAAAEEAVHFALLEHPDPQRVLLIGGGLNGSVDQALGHPSVEHIDYVELDPIALTLAARYFPSEWDKMRQRASVRIHAVDGRRFVKSTSDKFDVIIINLPDPHTAQLNRFYTEEFYREAAAKLRRGGILSFQVTSSENYISLELADFLRCLNRTLRQVFPQVVAIPGETIHFIAATQSGTLTTDPRELVRRMRTRRLHTEYVREYFLPYRMSTERMGDLHAQIEPLNSTPVNRDFSPVAYYFDMVLWSAPFHPASARWFEGMASVSFRATLLGTAVALALLVLLLWLEPGRRQDQRHARARRSAALAVTVAGFTGIGLEILLLLGFQALYGYVYHELTILVALFMVGAALGGGLALRWIKEMPCRRRELQILAGLQFVLAASPLLLYGLLVELGRVSGTGGQLFASELLLPLVALVSGFVGGCQFPLAGRIYFPVAVPAAESFEAAATSRALAQDHPARSSGLGTCARPVTSNPAPTGTPADVARKHEDDSSPGALYALDLAGACLGALALSLLLIPVFGFLRSAALMAVLNLAPVVMALLSSRTA